MMSRWRHAFVKLVPSWLYAEDSDGEKVLYTLGRLTDGFIERARRSLTARFPTYSGPTGLAMLGDERGIIKGKGESNAGYARRLRGWRGPNGHQVRGNAYSMLNQIWNYFGGMLCREIDTGGNVYTIDRDGNRSATHGGVWNWDGDSSWYRFWLKLVPDVDQGITAQPTFGQVEATGKTFGQAEANDETWGQQGVTHADTQVVRNLFRGAHPWHMAGTKPEWLILVLEETGTDIPNGTWHNWTYNGAASRPSNCRFWKL